MTFKNGIIGLIGGLALSTSCASLDKRVNDCKNDQHLARIILPEQTGFHEQCEFMMKSSYKNFQTCQEQCIHDPLVCGNTHLIGNCAHEPAYKDCIENCSAKTYGEMCSFEGQKKLHQEYVKLWEKANVNCENIRLF